MSFSNSEVLHFVVSNLVPVCPDPPLPVHAVIAHVSTPTYKHGKGSRIFYKCEQGYHLAGLMFIYCLGQQWTRVKFSCIGKNPSLFQFYPSIHPSILSSLPPSIHSSTIHSVGRSFVRFFFPSLVLFSLTSDFYVHEFALFISSILSPG